MYTSNIRGQMLVPYTHTPAKRARCSLFAELLYRATYQLNITAPFNRTKNNFCSDRNMCIVV